MELSEPDWCKYHVKVATKYMCGGKANNGDRYKKRTRAGDEIKVKCMPKIIN